MSRDVNKEVVDWIPDTPREWAQIGSAVNRLGIAMSAIGAFQHNSTWVLITLGATWLGHETSEYFKVYTQKNVKDEIKKPD